MSNDAKMVRSFRFPNLWAFLFATFIVIYMLLKLFMVRPLIIHGEYEVNSATSSQNSFHPVGFDGKCHKAEYVLFKGKKLSYFPQNAGVYEAGLEAKDFYINYIEDGVSFRRKNNISSSSFINGTYIKIDKNQIVTDVFCINKLRTK